MIRPRNDVRKGIIIVMMILWLLLFFLKHGDIWIRRDWNNMCDGNMTPL